MDPILRALLITADEHLYPGEAVGTCEIEFQVCSPGTSMLRASSMRFELKQSLHAGVARLKQLRSLQNASHARLTAELSHAGGYRLLFIWPDETSERGSELLNCHIHVSRLSEEPFLFASLNPYTASMSLATPGWE